MNRVRILFVAVLVFSVVSSSLGSIKDDGDFQYWATAKAKFDINKDWHGTVEEEFRLGDDAERLGFMKV